MDKNYLTEPERKIEIVDSADVIVSGGGPAGVAAAISAAREGVSVILLERYGYLGGLATGGLVILIPHLSDGSQQLQIRGFCEEVIKKLDEVDGALHPNWDEIGSDDPNLIQKWLPYFSVVVEGKIRMSVYVDPEKLKCILSKLIADAGVKLYLHSLVCGVVTKDNKIEGLIFESKEGRKGITGKVIIDTTGDGDILASAGEDYVTFDPYDQTVRSSTVALVFRLGNVNTEKFIEFVQSNRDIYTSLMQELEKNIGFRALPMLSWREDVVWVNNWLLGINPLVVRDLTKAELLLRDSMLKILDFLKKKLPGFQKAYVIDSASQLGIRGSRRLIGKYVFSKEDVFSGGKHPDTIAVFPSITHNTSKEHPLVYLPLRCLLPKRIENLIVAGRCFSSDKFANDLFNLIPHCIAMGQAAGVTAAIAVKEGVNVQNVDHSKVKERLKFQGVFLGE